jgi:type I restriction-modification system DNA methylase subunit
MVEKECDWLNPASKAGVRPAQSTEVLFIEQCYNYLKDNGYLAIVIPDGILTNSSLQYVRDRIEEMYRIVAVISLPQTAFTHTGAGVKSSVLFLRKHPLSMTKKIQKTREDIQIQVRQEQDYQNEYKRIIQTRDEHIKKLKGFSGDHSMPKSELLNTEGYKEWKKAVISQYAEQIDELKEKSTDMYDELKMKAFSSPKLDYRIFMAIVEDVGYDATGRPTENNELKQVVDELTRFIDAIEMDEE